MERNMKKECDLCKHSFNRVYQRSDKFLCSKCRNRYDTRIPGRVISGNKKTLKQVLDKIYTPGVYINNGSVSCRIHLPSVMQNKKFKIVLVEDDI